MDVWAQLVLTGLGSGSAVAIVMRAWLATKVQLRKVDAKDDSDTRALLVELLRAAQDEKLTELEAARREKFQEREATGKHQTLFLDCQEELLAAKTELAEQKATTTLLQRRVDQLEQERNEAEWKIRALENQVRELAKQLGIRLAPIEIPATAKSLPPPEEKKP